MERDAEQIRNLIRPLRGERREALARIGLDLALMAFLIGRLAKARRIIQTIRRLYRQTDQMGKLELLLTLAGEILGVIDLKNLASRVADINEETRPLARELNQLYAKIDHFFRETRAINQKYQNSECRQIIREGAALS